MGKSRGVLQPDKLVYLVGFRPVRTPISMEQVGWPLGSTAVLWPPDVHALPCVHTHVHPHTHEHTTHKYITPVLLTSIPTSFPFLLASLRLN